MQKESSPGSDDMTLFARHSQCPSEKTSKVSAPNEQSPTKIVGGVKEKEKLSRASGTAASIALLKKIPGEEPLEGASGSP
jgi:hypothetical protein